MHGLRVVGIRSKHQPMIFQKRLTCNVIAHDLYLHTSVLNKSRVFAYLSSNIVIELRLSISNDRTLYLNNSSFIAYYSSSCHHHVHYDLKKKRRCAYIVCIHLIS